METRPDTRPPCVIRLIVTETTCSVLKRAGLSGGGDGDEIWWPNQPPERPPTPQKSTFLRYNLLKTAESAAETASTRSDDADNAPDTRGPDGEGHIGEWEWYYARLHTMR